MPTDTAEPPGDMAHLVGKRLPGGHFRLEPFENWLAHDALYSSPRANPHPVMAYAATQRGMGMTVAELFEMLGTDITQGPLLAGCTLEFPGEFRTATDYTVAASIESILRKETRTAGPVDFVTCRMELTETATGHVEAIVTNVYALPRSSS
jgi:hypothetical protein